MQERRKYTRTLLETWVEIAAAGERRRAVGIDVSTDGLGLDGAHLAAGDRLVAEFPLPGIRLPLELRASVVWADAPARRAGLRFVEVDPGLRELLESFVAGRLSD